MLDYSEVTRDDFPQMLDLYERFLNAGDCVARHLRQELDGPDYVGVKCMDGERMAGVLTAHPGVQFTCGHEELAEEIRSRWDGRRIYTLDMLTVLPEYRRQGIARNLVEKCGAALKNRRCELLVTEGWIRSSDGSVHVSRILKYFGTHVTLGVYEDFYIESERYGIVCPECGARCRCGAQVSVIEIQ